jgi:hypothetical protein
LLSMPGLGSSDSGWAATAGQPAGPASHAEQDDHAAAATTASDGPPGAVGVELAATMAASWRGRTRRAKERALVGLQREVAELEAAATTVGVFQPALVPGLTQTPDYARAVYQAFYTEMAPEGSRRW